jgi:hypothetical protein
LLLVTPTTHQYLHYRIIEAPTLPVDINDADGDYDYSDEYYDITPAESAIDEMLIQFIKDKRKISALTKADVLESAKRIKKFEDLIFNKE